MIGDKQFDCREMFRHACVFCEIADMAQKKFMHETADLGFYNVPAAVNSAFACEVFLKAILLYSDIKIPKKHDLKTLFEKLPEDIRNWVKETVIAKNGKWENYFGFEYLDNISKAFAQWRYIYEIDLSNGGSIKFETGFLTLFRNTLREACCELFFKKTWEEYKQ